MKSATSRGIVFALAAALIYGAVPNLARWAYLEGVPAVETVFYRTSAVAVCLAIVAIIREENFVIPRAAWGGFGLQALATFIVSTSYLASIQYVSVGLAVIIFYTFPILVVIMAPLIEGHRPSLARLGVAVLGFSGLITAVGPGFDSFNLLGLVLAASAAFGCALQLFSGRALSRHVAPAAFGSLVHLAIWPLVLAIALATGHGRFALLDNHSSGAAAFAVGSLCLAYLGAYFLHMSSVKAAPASVVAPFFNLEPVVTTAIAMLFLGEMMSQNHAIGGVLVLAALFLAGLIRDGARVQ